MGIEFVFRSRLAPRVVILVLRFSPFIKTDIPKFQFDRDRGARNFYRVIVDEGVASFLKIEFIYSKCGFQTP